MTADGFEGLRALLLPEDKRAPFGGAERRRHHKSVTSVEFGGRWSLLRNMLGRHPKPEEPGSAEREESIEAFRARPASAVRRGLATNCGKGIFARFLV